MSGVRVFEGKISKKKTQPGRESEKVRVSGRFESEGSRFDCTYDQWLLISNVNIVL